MDSSAQTIGSNTYGALLNDTNFAGDTPRLGIGLTSIDFIPRVLESDNFFKKSTYENFRTLIGHANDFLRSNKQWRIVNCEGVKYKSQEDPLKMTYSVHANDRATYYVRGLRLWLAERNEDTQKEQQIDYINLIPRELDEQGNFETLDTVMKRFNSLKKLDPIPGRIISIQSQGMKIKDFRDFDPDRSDWSEYLGRRRTNIFVLRIFYDTMAGKSSTEIGVKDFIPEQTVKENGIFSLPKYESFSSVLNKASEWCVQQNDLQFCNVQTLRMKFKKGEEVDTQKMKYSHNSMTATYFVRIVRVAFTKPFASNSSNSGKTSPIRELTCRTFEAEVYSTSLFCDETENFARTRERISAWVQATGAQVLNAETTARTKTAQKEEEDSFTCDVNKDEYWRIFIRLYINGVYEEPPPEMLPPLPVSNEECCHVS